MVTLAVVRALFGKPGEGMKRICLLLLTLASGGHQDQTPQRSPG